jgi:hypothetical protein
MLDHVFSDRCHEQRFASLFVVNVFFSRLKRTISVTWNFMDIIMQRRFLAGILSSFERFLRQKRFDQMMTSMKKKKKKKNSDLRAHGWSVDKPLDEKRRLLGPIKQSFLTHPTTAPLYTTSQHSGTAYIH